jgi:antitoxin component YwqK of YwqJK toxin-antitoxin module
MNKENFTWYESGAKKASHKFVYISNGTYTSWYENGQKEHEYNFKNNVQHGIWRSWYEDGQISSESSYIRGIWNGVWATWYENGQKNTEMKFITDNRIFSMNREMKLYEIRWSEDGKETHKKIFFDERNLPKFRNPLSLQSVNTSLTGACVDPQIKLKDKIKSWFD